MIGSYILKLQDIREEHFTLVGGKAANLAKLVQWNLPTLDGFCVTTKAYRNFLQFSNLDNKIADIIDDIKIDDLAQVDIGSRNIRTLIENAKLPSDITQAIQSAYTSLEESAVAIRSSATAEDLPLASFAGQQESYLNITDLKQVLEHIKLCWGSLWTPRAIQYRARQGVGNNRVYMAVVVQIMIQAEVSGVMFTANPLNNRHDQIVINASYGLGEPIVSGDVTPDTYVLDKVSLQVLQVEIGAKEKMVLSHKNGGTQNKKTDVAKQNLPSLPQDLVIAIGKLGKQVETHFHAPQDVEWAYAKGSFILLQARPITTQNLEKAIPPVRYNRLERFFLGFLLDYFPTPPYHFDRSVLLNLLEETLSLATVFGLDPPEAQEIMKVESDGVISLNPVLPKLTWQTPVIAIKGIIQAFRSLSIDPGVFPKKRWPRIENKLRDLQKYNLRDMPDAELISFIRKCISIRDDDIFKARFDYFLGCWLAMIVLPLLLRLIAGKENSRNLFFALMSGLDHPTAIMNRQLRNLSRNALSVDAIKDILEKGVSKVTWSELETTNEGRAFLNDVRLFLEHFGMRTGMLIPFPSAPVWREDPIKVLSLIEIMLRNPKTLLDELPQRQKNQALEAKSSALELAGRFPFGVLKTQKLVGFLVQYTQDTLIERDWIILAYETANEPIRNAMLEIGNRLSDRFLQLEENDVRFLSLGEVEKALSQHSLDEFNIQLQKKVRTRKLARTKTTSNWNVVTPKLKAKGMLLRGTPASPGTVSGVARIISSENEFSKLNVGDILVCHSTNPSWTPLFAIASGVVTDIGGPLSHAAIVAREYGIPAVLGTQSAMATMVNGQCYTIDGTNGHVFVSKGN